MPSYNSNSIYQIGNCSRLEGSRNSNDSRLDNSSTKVRNNNKWMQISEKIPVLDDLTEESVSELKLRLIEIIAEFRMYKNEDFETLQNLFESKNQIIGKYVAQEVFIEILEALSSWNYSGYVSSNQALDFFSRPKGEKLGSHKFIDF